MTCTCVGVLHSATKVWLLPLFFLFFTELMDKSERGLKLYKEFSTYQRILPKFYNNAILTTKNAIKLKGKRVLGNDYIGIEWA